MPYEKDKIERKNVVLYRKGLSDNGRGPLYKPIAKRCNDVRIASREPNDTNDENFMKPPFDRPLIAKDTTPFEIFETTQSAAKA